LPSNYIEKNELSINLQEVANEILSITEEIKQRGGNEEDLKVNVEKILDEKVWRIRGIRSPKYEYTIKGVKGTIVKHYRLDALYGLAIFEYKAPGVLSRIREVEETIKKMKEAYIPALLEEEGIDRLVNEIRARGLSPRIVGVLFDGYNVILVEYNVDTKTFTVNPEVGAYPFNADSLRLIIRVVEATYKKKPDATTLARDFGYRSTVAQKAVLNFYNALVSPKNKKTEVFFEEWKKLVSYAYPLSSEQLARIAEFYGFPKEQIKQIDGLKLFFAIQTYYALVLKLLAAEIAARFYDTTANIYLERLRNQNIDLRKELNFLESGYIYQWYKIRNFLEGDLFKWYIDEWNQEISQAVKEIIEKLNDYNVEALTFDLSTARDIFKLLYEELVPREEVRKFLGIYTTPDWLAELILDELGLSAKGLSELESQGIDPLNIKILDPGVGTGTFLSLVIQRIASYLKNKYNNRIPEDVAKQALIAITRNIIGFDIDILALLTAKTNYLLALAATDLLTHKGNIEIEIPIYMANSIVTAKELKEYYSQTVDGKYVSLEVVKVSTSVGNFFLPAKLVESNLFHSFLLETRDLLEKNYSSNDSAVKNAFKSYLVGCTTPEEQNEYMNILKSFYDKLFNLKSKGMDSVWVPIIKSYIYPTLFREQFHYVVGNPPWLAYRYIADLKYQETVKELVSKTYELVKDEHLMTHMEMATLFFVRSLDIYLKDKGYIGFVMPRSIFSSDQHSNFRSQSIQNVSYKFIKIIDCKDVEPLFYVPTCAVIARKGETTKFPIDATIVSGKLPAEKHKVIPLEEVKAKNYLTFREGEKLYLNSIGERNWFDYKELSIQTEKGFYFKEFRQGATLVPQSCWFVEVSKDLGDTVIVTTSRRVKVRGKVEQEIPPMPVEKKFIYGVLTSAEIMPFCHLLPNLAVLPIIPSGNKYMVITKENAKNFGYNYLANWLNEAEEIWKSIRGEKLGRMTMYQRLDYQRGITAQKPKASFKVVYLRSGTNLASTVINVNMLKKINPLLQGIIIESTLYYYETDNKDEAAYLASILNSPILDELIKPMQSKGQFGERDIHKKPLEFPIEQFNPQKPIHIMLSNLGKKATIEAFKLLPAVLKEYGYNEKLKERGVLMPQEVAIVRKHIRDELQSLLSQIDDLVTELLKNADQDSNISRYLQGD
jgi:hypothetical protein